MNTSSMWPMLARNGIRRSQPEGTAPNATATRANPTSPQANTGGARSNRQGDVAAAINRISRRTFRPGRTRPGTSGVRKSPSACSRPARTAYGLVVRGHRQAQRIEKDEPVRRGQQRERDASHQGGTRFACDDPPRLPARIAQQRVPAVARPMSITAASFGGDESSTRDMLTTMSAVARLNSCRRDARASRNQPARAHGA